MVARIPVKVTLVVRHAERVLTFVAPLLLGMGIAWEAHVGGYIAGMLLMTVLPAKGYRPPKS